MAIFRLGRVVLVCPSVSSSSFYFGQTFGHCMGGVAVRRGAIWRFWGLGRAPVFRGWENRNFVRPISVAFSPSMLFRPLSLFFIFAAARPCPGIAVRRLTWKRSSTPCSEQHAASSSSPLPSGKQEYFSIVVYSDSVSFSYAYFSLILMRNYKWTC